MGADTQGSADTVSSADAWSSVSRTRTDPKIRIHPHAENVRSVSKILRGVTHEYLSTVEPRNARSHLCTSLVSELTREVPPTKRRHARSHCRTTQKNLMRFLLLKLSIRFSKRISLLCHNFLTWSTHVPLSNWLAQIRNSEVVCSAENTRQQIPSTRIDLGIRVHLHVVMYEIHPKVSVERGRRDRGRGPSRTRGKSCRLAARLRRLGCLRRN